MESRVHGRRQEEIGVPMIIGAVIAGLLIVSLFLEMVSSSPKPSEERHPDVQSVK
jgi:hypothetical protein